MKYNQKRDSLKTNLNKFNSKVLLGQPIETKYATLIPVVTLTTFYWANNNDLNTVGGGIILDPLAIIVDVKGKRDTYSLRDGMIINDISEITNVN